MLESPFNRFAGFKTCNFLKKGLKHRKIPAGQVAGPEARKSIKRRMQFLLFTVNIFKRENAVPASYC